MGDHDSYNVVHPHPHLTIAYITIDTSLSISYFDPEIIIRHW